MREKDWGMGSKERNFGANGGGLLLGYKENAMLISQAEVKRRERERKEKSWKLFLCLKM